MMFVFAMMRWGEPLNGFASCPFFLDFVALAGVIFDRFFERAFLAFLGFAFVGEALLPH